MSGGTLLADGDDPARRRPARRYSSISSSANPNSAPPSGRGAAQIRPPIAATSRAHTNSPIPAPLAAPAVPGDRYCAAGPPGHRFETADPATIVDLTPTQA